MLKFRFFYIFQVPSSLLRDELSILKLDWSGVCNWHYGIKCYSSRLASNCHRSYVRLHACILVTCTAAKYGFAQSLDYAAQTLDYAAQTMDPYFARQSMYCAYLREQSTNSRTIHGLHCANNWSPGSLVGQIVQSLDKDEVRQNLTCIIT